MNLNKREYNSERRRKHDTINSFNNKTFIIRENITPRGDGNFLIPLLFKTPAKPTK